MKKGSAILVLLLVGFILLQFFRPEKIDEGIPAKNLTSVPKEVNAILRSSCFSCHSSEANLSWFDQITPANFLVADHIKEGRKALDFSNWDKLPDPKKNATIYFAVNAILSGEMPLASYTALHPSAKLNAAQIEVLKNYALTLAPKKEFDSSKISALEKQFEDRLHTNKTSVNVKPALNGIAYIPDYRNWKAISTTDRFDNGTMRIIFGNDIAVKAIENHQTNPWPDGTVFAKTAWKQLVLADGSIETGEFVQVEFMIKNKEKYATTKGWGWARWKGMDLKPYGEKADFANECVQCHVPVKKRDYVFTSPLNLISNLKKIQQK